MKTLTLNDYIITKDGNVINKHNNHIVKPQKNGKGYLRVAIGGKLEFVHRLVATIYIPNPNNKPQVNHKNGNKLDNNVQNLEWVTNSENRTHAVRHNLHLCGEQCPWSKLTKENVMFIRNNPNLSNKELQAKFNISRGALQSIKQRKTWKTV